MDELSRFLWVTFITLLPIAGAIACFVVKPGDWEDDGDRDSNGEEPNGGGSESTQDAATPPTPPYGGERQSVFARKPRRRLRIFLLLAGAFIAAVLAVVVGEVLVWRIDVLSFIVGRETSSCPADERGTNLFSFGKVAEVTGRGLKVTEYDFEKDKDVVVDYRFTDDTELGNIDKLADLKPGDDVVLDYELSGKKRVVTTLVKEVEGETDAEAVEDAVPPMKGRLVIASGFQQIGDTEDGGGILRSATGMMAIMTDDPAEQKRLSALERKLPAPRPAASPRMDLSGIEQWLTANELPTVSQARQVRVFGPHRLLVWRGKGWESTVALWRSNVLQFAFAGSGLATTGPMLPANPGDPTLTYFDGPPAGTDLDGDGVPDLLVYDYSGGAHCCHSIKHIVCSDPPVLTAQISGWHCQPVYEDLDGDGRYEMTVGDSSYAYWNACYAGSPQPVVIYSISRGRYEMAGDLMRRRALSKEKIQSATEKLRYRLSRLDIWDARHSNGDSQRKLTAEEDADDYFFSTQCWHDEQVRIPPDVWALLLDLIYSGQIDQAVKALDTVWPNGKPGKEAFARDLLAMICGSWHGSRLPWFAELETAFGKSREKKVLP